MTMFDATRVPLLARALDAYAMRQKVIAENIANIETPGYKPKTVSFERELADAMNGAALPGTVTDPRHLPLGTGGTERQPRVEEAVPAGKSGAPGGTNPVDIDSEMTDLAVNQIRFRFAARLLGETFRGLQKSIRGQV